MTNYIGLMAGLLALGVFFEDYARGRSHVFAEACSENGRTEVRALKRILHEGESPSGALAKLRFSRPGTLRGAPRASYALAAVNLALLAFVIWQHREHSWSSNPQHWDSNIVTASILGVAHCCVAWLVYRSEHEFTEDLRLRSERFGDNVIAELLDSYLQYSRDGLYVEHATGDRIALTHTGAPADRPLEDGEFRTLNEMSAILLPALRMHGWLSSLGLVEAESVESLMRLSDAEMHVRSYRVSFDSDDYIAFLQERHAGLIGALSPPPTSRQSVARSLAESRLAEVLHRGAALNRSERQHVSREILDSLVSRIAPRALRVAAVSADARTPIFPTWIYPRSPEVWKTASDRCSDDEVSGMGRLLVRACASSATPADRQSWRLVTARLVSEDTYGFDLIGALSLQLTRGELRDGSIIDQLTAGVPDHQVWCDPRVRMALGVAIALEREGKHRKARDLLIRAVGNRSVRTTSLAEAVHLVSTRFQFLEYRDLCLSLITEVYATHSEESSDTLIAFAYALIKQGQDQRPFDNINGRYWGSHRLYCLTSAMNMTITLLELNSGGASSRIRELQNLQRALAREESIFKLSAKSLDRHVATLL